MGFKKNELTFISVIIFGFLLFSLIGHMEERTQVVVREDTTSRVKKHAPVDSETFCVYLITRDQVSNYWQQIDIGCQKAVQELGNIDYHWTAPPKNNVEDQREVIQQAVNDGAEAILLAASSYTELNDVLDKATAAGIRLIYVDSPASHPALAELVTDNVDAGRIAGRTMLQALEEAGIKNGTIGLAAGSSNGKNATLRSQGFREIFQGTGFTVAPTVAHDGNRENIEKEVINHPEYVGFFGANEQVTWIISEQVQASRRKSIIVGFDTSDFTLSMIQKGIIYATIQQNTEKMGYEGIMLAVASLRGESVGADKKKDMGVNVITKNRL